jgi:hypothetical protein
MSEARNKEFYFRDSRLSSASKYLYTTTAPALIYFLPVILGGLIYFVLMPGSIIFYSWLEYFNVYNPIYILRLNLPSYIPYFPNWFIYSLPNGLWAFSYTAIIVTLWSKRTESIKYFWFSTIPIICMGYEAMQYMGVIRGAFCFTDLSFCFLGMILGLTIYKTRR